ncbi:hypothetical protein TNCV_3504901 [Trichonephila clavipes]|uniref:Uncharacterized protein n=1 Tax=Trichonephila clavipes TaxID=2585209 RepID=A0A8X6S124_TRICX|nr:hypothetical protein TNCV_3504901 [Trichonephila clavipes]
MRGTVVLMENPITVRITEQHKMDHHGGDHPATLRTELHSGVFYTPVSVLSCPGQTCSLMVTIEQWFSRRSTALETHTVKVALHSPFTD